MVHFRKVRQPVRLNHSRWEEGQNEEVGRGKVTPCPTVKSLGFALNYGITWLDFKSELQGEAGRLLAAVGLPR